MEINDSNEDAKNEERESEGHTKEKKDNENNFKNKEEGYNENSFSYEEEYNEDIYIDNEEENKKKKKNKKSISIFSALNKKIKRNKEKANNDEKEQFTKLFEILRKEEDSYEKGVNHINDLIIITPIAEYVKSKQEEWEKNKRSDKFSMKQFAKSIGILQDFNYIFLNNILNKEDIDSFIRYYKFFQFTLTAKQRKEIQNKIKGKCNFPIITKNFIPDTINDIKEIFINICKSLVDLKLTEDKEFLKDLKNIFIINNVYSEKNFDSIIPVEFANRELKLNKLIFEIVDFFYKSSLNYQTIDKDEIKLMKSKCIMFRLFKKIIEKINLFSDDELFTVFNYLFNCIYIFFDVAEAKKNYELFYKIITCCMPFELAQAKELLKELKIMLYEDLIEIDGITLENYVSTKLDDLKAESIIYLKNKEIKVSCKDINWNLSASDFQRLLISDTFMLCFRFPKLREINYLCINDKIKKSYQNLFKTIIQSEIMEEAMNIDEDTKKFKYPFKNDLILNEIENNCFLVPIPAKNYFGISDRNAFAIYLNSFIDSSEIKSIFTDIDNICKFKCHEIKHMYRIYLRLFKPDIQLKTPDINLKGFSTNKLTKNKFTFFKKRMEIMNNIYKSKNVIINVIQKLDYGDVLEFAINGDKQNVFFIKNSFFCLSEDSWKLNKKVFMFKYFEACFDKNFYFKRNSKNIFINNIIDYFKLETNKIIYNEADTTKRSSKGKFNELDNIDNNYCYIPRASHFRK